MANDLSVQPRRRYVATTDSDQDGPIYLNLARDIVSSGPNQLWVADLTYIAIATGFGYWQPFSTLGHAASSAMPSASGSTPVWRWPR